MNVRLKDVEAVLRLDATARIKMDYLMALCAKGNKPFLLTDPDIIKVFGIERSQDISKRMYNLFVAGLASRAIATEGSRGRPAYIYTLVPLKSPPPL
jgi:predicted transcriptional regulator